MSAPSLLEDRPPVPGCRGQSLGKQRLAGEDVSVSLASVCCCGDQGLGRAPLGGMDPRGPAVPPPTEQVRQDSPSATRGTLEGQVRQGCAPQV